MNDKLLGSFKDKLEKQKDAAYNLLEQMEKNETIKSNNEIANELSLYDNHPADNAGPLNDRQRGMALQKNETVIVRKIDEALHNIESGTYGVCKRCGKEIGMDRLEFIPYAEYCVDCQKILDSIKPSERNNRPPEEDVLERTVDNGYDGYYDQVGFDMEDSYGSVGRFNRRKNIVEDYVDQDENYVDPVERISNGQYKSQLP